MVKQKNVRRLYRKMSQRGWKKGKLRRALVGKA